MSSSNSDYSPDNDNEDYLTPRILRRRSAASMGRATRSGSGRRKARKIEKPKATTIPRDEETLLLYLDSVNKKLKGADYDAATSSRVIRAALTLQFVVGLGS
jgi:hypothetical protein